MNRVVVPASSDGVGGTLPFLVKDEDIAPILGFYKFLVENARAEEYVRRGWIHQFFFPRVPQDMGTTSLDGFLTEAERATDADIGNHLYLGAVKTMRQDEHWAVYNFVVYNPEFNPEYTRIQLGWFKFEQEQVEKAVGKADRKKFQEKFDEAWFNQHHNSSRFRAFAALKFCQHFYLKNSAPILEWKPAQ